MTLIAWIVILPAAVGAILTGIQAGSHAGEQDYHRARVSGVAAAVLACLAVCAAGIVGVLPGMAAVILGAAAAFTALGCVWYEQGSRAGDSARLGVIMADVAAAARAATRPDHARKSRHPGGRPSGPAVITGHAEPAAPPRQVPPAVTDPGLHQPLPDEADITPAGIDKLWAALCSHVASFEPEDAAGFMAFYKAQCAGVLAYAEAMGAAAENCGEAGAGLDPAITQAQYEAGDVIGGAADGLALVRRRLIVVYGPQLEAAAGGLVYPYEARKFFGDGDVAA
jgi:hypothetical protein